ncbi:acyl-CoA dehydrogenase family protein [Nocardioides sp. YIM B13467]|uniref:acyl-CoA dehydrogenase family protein n=1 Tax=Nocardioides sp. YIM B13467 TaxID=3366294 RepID=UPI00366E169F
MTTTEEHPTYTPTRTTSSDVSAGHEALIERARSLVPLLAEHADATEKARRLVPEVEQALRDAGMFKLTVPRRFGGHQADMRTYIAVTSELARGCSSAAWVTMILGGGAFSTSLFSDRAQMDVWGEAPDAAVAGVLTPSATSRKVEGGHVVSGRWMWNSGCYNAQWTVLAAPINDENGQMVDLGLLLVPYSDLTIEDTWYVAGMQGTGSNTAVGDEIFVPDHRIISMLGLSVGQHASEHPEEVEYQAPPVTALTLAILGPQLGIAQAALERTRETLAKGKPIAYSTYQRSIDAPSYQLNFADATSLIDTAKLHAFRAADDIDAWGRAGEFPADLGRARVRMDIAVAATRLREAVDLLLNIGGAGSFAQANPINRIWRDLETASRHGYINSDLSREIYARALLGIEPQVSQAF